MIFQIYLLLLHKFQTQRLYWNKALIASLDLRGAVTEIGLDGVGEGIVVKVTPTALCIPIRDWRAH